ncbi:hypothetical protein SDC9_157462 [bioreactor metagenome]|uniref:Uncharacterized protein n=1 Tax=bioreactor metagenome TaxID=1076179 RepID=A0A645F7G6_9ZZZZ
MTSMPATARLIAAIPATARVSAPSSLSKVARTASWVITVTSSSPRWRCLRSSSDCVRAAGMASRLLASIRMRKRVLELNIAWARETGTMTSSSVFMPSPWPSGLRTPMTRRRRSPTRTSCPTAGSVPKISWRSLAPMMATDEPRFQSSSGRGLPWASSKLRMGMNSAVEPATMASRSLPPWAISEVPTASGATRRTLGRRRRLAASSMVRSRGVEVMALAGLKPPVPERPGSTMTRLVPSDENWPTT